ncbi:MAG TPA: TspO/MBR family protein [Candidatus Paceibacterota bacterium]
MKTYEWYQTLSKPMWAPPTWLFAPVWTALYTIIAISYGYVGYLFFAKKISFIIVLPFVLNLIFNFAFTPIQFGLQNNFLAALDILLVLGTLVWALVAVYPHVKWVTYVNIPYLVWVLFATVLQLTITFTN